MHFNSGIVNGVLRVLNKVTTPTIETNKINDITSTELGHLTGAKSNVQGQINTLSGKVTDCLQSVTDGKKTVATAITGKGVTTNPTDSFATMAQNINAIATGTSELYNFPLTISLTEPTPVRQGHIWVKNNNSAKIKNITIDEAIRANIAEGDLLFVVGDLALRNYTLKQNKSADDGSTKSLAIADSTATVDWLVSSITDGFEYKLCLTRPLVYSYIDGVFDIEDAFMWDGEQWIILGQKGAYIAVNVLGSSSTASPEISGVHVYNVRDNKSFFKNCAVAGGVSISYGQTKFTANGQYLIASNSVYKRTGDTFEKYFSADYIKITAGYVYPEKMDISEDGSTLVVLSRLTVYDSYYQRDQYYAYTLAYKNTGTTFELESTAEMNRYSTAYKYNDVKVSPDGNLILVAYQGETTSDPVQYKIAYNFRVNGKFTEGLLPRDNTGSAGISPYSYYLLTNLVIHNDSFMIIARSSSSSDFTSTAWAENYKIDYANFKIRPKTADEGRFFMNTLINDSNNNRQLTAYNRKYGYYFYCYYDTYNSKCTFARININTGDKRGTTIPAGLFDYRGSYTYGYVQGIGVNLNCDLITIIEKRYVSNNTDQQFFYIHLFSYNEKMHTLTLLQTEKCTNYYRYMYGCSICPT